MTKKEFERSFKFIQPILTSYIMKYGKVSRDDASDIVQLTAYNSFRYLVLRKKQIRCSFKTFVYTVARNELVDNIRRNVINSKHEMNFSSFANENGSFNIEDILKSKSSDECFDNAADDATKVELYKHLLSLKEKHKEYYDTLCLHVIHEKGYLECANILNVPIGTIKSRIFKARKFLNENMPETLKDLNTSN